MRALFFLIAAVSFVGCVQPEDNPTNVHDLRVLGVNLEPSEVLMPGCDARLIAAAAAGAADGGTVMLPPQLQQLLLQYAATEVQYTALIADPAGQGRSLRYRLSACANRADRDCNDEGDFVDLDTGETTGGELVKRMRPGATLLNDGSPLLVEVVNFDTFKGLGGIRLPISLELSAPDTGEKVYVQKLMVYTCQFFPTMRQNVTPVLPGIKWNGESWPEGEVKQWSGKDEVPLEPEDFSALQEDYVVPSLMLQPVQLTESWKVTWTTTSGTMSSYTTGGVDVVGEASRHNSRWMPDQKATEPTDVNFWFIVRDGRGGMTWLQRQARWTP